MDIDEYRNQLNEINNNLDNTISHLEAKRDEAQRVIDIIENTPSILNELEDGFKTKTKLTEMDMCFLLLATGLQVARQYLISNEKFRLAAKQGDKLIESTLSLAPPSWQEILTQSVPYDAIKTSSHVTDTGLAGTTHRYRTLGHDPVLGWIFGTANIMTNSLTKTDLETYQVKNMQIIRHYPMGAFGMMDRAVSYSIEDVRLLAVSVARQAIHFGSDYFTKQGLPVPIIATVDNTLAQKMLSNWHIDMWSITRNMTLSSFINQLISFMHKLFCTDESEQEQKLYEVRTRRIIDISNTIASTSNIIYAATKEDLSNLDIGGLIVTLYRLISDSKFIASIKYEYVFGAYKNMILVDDKIRIV